MLETLTAIENALMQINFFAWFDLLRGVMRHGRLHRFETIDTPMLQGESALRRYGIHCYGRGVEVRLQTDKEGRKRRSYLRWFHVNRKQANFAEYILVRHGIQPSNPLNAKNWAAAGRGRFRAWDAKRSLRPTTLTEVISNLFGGGR
jgi:hypothetical protein